MVYYYCWLTYNLPFSSSAPSTPRGVRCVRVLLSPPTATPCSHPPTCPSWWWVYWLSSTPWDTSSSSRPRKSSPHRHCCCCCCLRGRRLQHVSSFFVLTSIISFVFSSSSFGYSFLPSYYNYRRLCLHLHLLLRNSHSLPFVFSSSFSPCSFLLIFLFSSEVFSLFFMDLYIYILCLFWLSS